MLWYVQKSTAWIRNIRKNAVFLVVRSEIHAQNTRPTPLPMLTTPTKPAAEMAFKRPIS